MAQRSDQELLLRSVFEQGSAEARSLRFDDEAAACAAAGVVRALGAARLSALGLDVPSRRGPELTEPPLTEAEGDALLEVFAGCLDLGAQVGEQLAAAGGLPTDVGRCVGERYVATDAFRDALLAPAIDEALADRIDRTLDSAVAACAPTGTPD